MEITSQCEPVHAYFSPVRVGRELWNARAILIQFARKEVSQRYRGSQLGMIWAFVQPLLVLVIYTAVFGLIMKIQWPEARGQGLGEVAMAVYCGLTVFGVFSECASRAPMLLLENRSYVKRALFPIQMLPVCVVISAAFHGLVNVVVLILLGWLSAGFYLPALLAPLVLVPLALLACGATLLLAAVGPLYRDLQHVLPPALLAVCFLTPIVYSPSLVPASLRWLVLMNPLAFTVTSLRQLVMWQGGCNWGIWGVWTLVCAGFMGLAYAVFMRLRSHLADVV